MFTTFSTSTEINLYKYKYEVVSETSPKSLIQSRRKCGRLGNTKTSIHNERYLSRTVSINKIFVTMGALSKKQHPIF